MRLSPVNCPSKNIRGIAENYNLTLSPRVLAQALAFEKKASATGNMNAKITDAQLILLTVIDDEALGKPKEETVPILSKTPDTLPVQEVPKIAVKKPKEA